MGTDVTDHGDAPTELRTVTQVGHLSTSPTQATQTTQTSEDVLDVSQWRHTAHCMGELGQTVGGGGDAKGQEHAAPSDLVRPQWSRWQGSLTVVVPALNEEANLVGAVRSIVVALEESGVEWDIIIVNDGSTDRTEERARELERLDGRITVLRHELPLGVGFSFREGVAASRKDAITWLPGDGENEPSELLKWLPLLVHVDIVNPFVINRTVRSWSRRALSMLYLWIVNISFGTTFNYTNGNVIYRRRVFDVVTPEANGFSFQMECLIKAIRAGFTFAEVPVRLRGRTQGESKALSLKSFRSVVGDVLRLFVEVHFRHSRKERSN